MVVGIAVLVIFLVALQSLLSCQLFHFTMSEDGDLLVGESTLHSVLIVPKSIVFLSEFETDVECSLGIHKPVIGLGVITKVGGLES